MRQWLVRADLMCRPHLLGEHLEAHMFQGSMRGNISLQGYYDNNLFFGPIFLLHRHNELTMFLKGQLIQHKTQMTLETIGEAVGPLPGLVHSRLYYADTSITTDMIKQSRMDLLSRCSTCRNLHLKEKREGRSHRYTIPPLSAISDASSDDLAISNNRGNT